MPPPTRDLTGQRFGRLVVVKRDPRPGNTYWICDCDCGERAAVPAQALLRPVHTRSCGCLQREVTVARSTTHGLAARGRQTPGYNSWHNMMSRCTNPNHPRYADWGGRGITVCDRWHDYRNFLADMGTKPPGKTLGRIDNDGNYEPGNCRWETHAQQARNTRSIKLTPRTVLDIQQLYSAGLPIGDIADEVGIRRHTVGTVCTVLDALATHP